MAIPPGRRPRCLRPDNLVPVQLWLDALAEILSVIGQEVAPWGPSVQPGPSFGPDKLPARNTMQPMPKPGSAAAIGSFPLAPMRRTYPTSWVPRLASHRSPFGHSARNGIVKTEVEGYEVLGGERCIPFQRKVGKHLAKGAIVVDGALHGEAPAQNGGDMGAGRFRD
jgi:hypothetical protein